METTLFETWSRAVNSNVQLFTSSDEHKLNDSCICISAYRIIAPIEQSNDKITKRQRFLFNQGYSYKAIRGLPNEDDNPLFSTKEGDQKLLRTILPHRDSNEHKQEKFTKKIVPSTGSLQRPVNPSNKLKHELFKTYRK
ncbi:unnamed protein product [Rotaria sp. Silwood2]|nr:unnamed protein product [Rotaria sp. Silwood2]CAF4315551.1 unnamed protein product [Rotaria sp. Silwood2]